MSSTLKNEKLLLNSIIKTRCMLGEGLYVDNETKSWIDIKKNNFFLLKGESLEKYNLKNKPSVILSREKETFLIGTKTGLVKFDTNLKEERIIKNFSTFHSLKNYRSNDGLSFDNYILLSFMHKSKPDIVPGIIYLIKNNKVTVLDNEIYIPNSFIKISKRKILITDSLKGIIWLFELDKDGSKINKKIWKDFNSKMTPDGGCLFNNRVFLSFWDFAAVGMFSLDGNLIKYLKVPSLRPTNCKVDPIKKEVWITSALEGLTKKEVETYPESGNTFSFSLKAFGIC